MNRKVLFDKNLVLQVMESLRCSNGAFIASVTQNYRAMWFRDALYAIYAYWYLGDDKKTREGMQMILDCLKSTDEDGRRGYKTKIMRRIASPVPILNGTLHTKCNAETFAEITTDDGWGHHQLCWIGLLLHIIADLDFKNVRVIRDESDIEIIQLLVFYLRSVEYWGGSDDDIKPDFGMWEICNIRHASSIGAVVDGLGYIRRRRIAQVPEPLIQAGEQALRKILPYESRDLCRYPYHRHCCDAAQLTLLWPHNVIVNPAQADEVLKRIIEGHQDTVHNEFHQLLQTHGLNRHWGDNYYRSYEGNYNGKSAEWSWLKFWLSIISSQHHKYQEAAFWFGSACTAIVDGMIAEAHQNGRPNEQMPLAWAQAIALIAFQKLPQEYQKEFAA